MSEFSHSSSSKRGPRREQGVQGFNDDVDADDVKVGLAGHIAKELLPTDEIISHDPLIFRRKVITEQVVPYIRKAKVKVKTQRIVPCTIKKTVMTTKQVEYQDFEEFEETYTEYVEEKAFRDKPVYVSEEVTEEYMKKVPVTKTKMVKKPVTQIVPVDDFTIVTIPGTKMIDVHGFRLDELEEKKLVEQVTYEVYEMRPHPTGKIVKGKSRELSRIDAEEHRHKGTKVYAEGDLGDTGIDFDAIPQDPDCKEPELTRTPLFRNSKGGVTHVDPETVHGFTNVNKWNANFEEVDQTVAEPFNLEKCLAYVEKFLTTVGADVSPHAFINEVRERWQFIDVDVSGGVSLEELRKAVWEREEDNEGKAMPDGKFPPALQDIVDMIYRGCGEHDPLSFWHFTNYLLGPEEQMAGVQVPPPPRSATWAHAF